LHEEFINFNCASCLPGGALSIHFVPRLRNTTLYISSVRKHDEGHYTCTASNALGHDEKTMTLRVAGKFFLAKKVQEC